MSEIAVLAVTPQVPNHTPYFAYTLPFLPLEEGSRLSIEIVTKMSKAK